MTEVDALMKGVGWGALVTALANAVIYVVVGAGMDRLWEWAIVEAVLALLVVARPAMVLARALDGNGLFDTRELLSSSLKGRLMGVVLGAGAAAWAWALSQ